MKTFETDPKFKELLNAINESPRDHQLIVSLGNQLYSKAEYLGHSTFIQELNGIFLDLLLEGESQIIGELEYLLEPGRIMKVGHDLFVHYVERKADSFLRHLQQIKGLKDSQTENLIQDIWPDLIDVSYYVINSVFISHKDYYGKNLDDVYNDLYSAKSFEDYARKILSLPNSIVGLSDNFRSNIKYTQSMFEYTDSLIIDGYKKMSAYRKTLEVFKMNPLNDDSYRRSYYKYLKNK